MDKIQVHIKISQGIVIGRQSKLPNGNIYHYFKGIPYAKPPLGNLRFEAPQLLEKFHSSEIDCGHEKKKCFQRDFLNELVGSEDCLYLNIYVPKTKSKKLLPVMVWIHGGGFSMGSGDSDIYDPTFLLQEKVILVTINYRLGILGFLSFPEGNIVGNAGLKDQLMALKWVQLNIQQFSGDPKNVTIFGESAGAASIHFHLFSSNSRKYFNKAIIQSGTSNLDWAIQKNASLKATRLAKLLGCKATSAKDIGIFLKNYSNLDEMYKNYNRVLNREETKRSTFLPIIFSPVIEPQNLESIVTEYPAISMKKINTVDIPVILGYTSNEGILMCAKNEYELEIIDKDPCKLMPEFLDVDETEPEFLKLSEKIRKFYFSNEKISMNTLQNFSNFMSDINFVYGIQEAAKNHRKYQPNSKLYLYQFCYDGNRNFYKKLLQLENLKGAAHGDDVFYLFKSYLVEEIFGYKINDYKDDKIIKLICKLWTNFAKTGNPTPLDTENALNLQWIPVQKNGPLNYLKIDTKTKMNKNPEKKRMELWIEIFESIKNNKKLERSKL